MISTRKRKGESANSLLYRFNKRVRQSGLIKESRKRRFTKRPVSKIKRRQSALHREEKKREYLHKKKMGTL
jgi:ribosomal protein S21